jgi:phosphatidylserine decarboxylase
MSYVPHPGPLHPIVQKLEDFIVKNPRFLADFIAAFNFAKSTGIPEFEEYHIRHLVDYIDFYNKTLTWIPDENTSGKKVYDRLCLFYFVIDQPPVRQWQNPIEPGQHAPWKFLSQWLIDYSKQVGLWMSTPGSMTQETFDTFLHADRYNLYQFIIPSPIWNKFNDFFARHIKPELRPIDPDPLVITSPADSTFDGKWDIDDNNEISVKGLKWSIDQLLEGSPYKDDFKGGKWMHAFLNTTDYHRQHAPIAGVVKEARRIEGLCYLEVTTKVDPGTGKTKMHMHRDLNAIDGAGYQFLQARGLIVIDNPVIGLVATLPIGMAQVSSVELSVKPEQKVEKGQEISYFQLGGSDIVVVFQRKSNVTITASGDGTNHYNFGEQIAIANPPWGQ